MRRSLALFLAATLGAAAPTPATGGGLDARPELAYHRVKVRVVSTLIARGRADLALEAASQLALDAPEDAATAVALGRALEAGGLLEEAERAFRRAARLDRRDPVSRDLLGRVLLRLGRTAEAVSQIRRATELAPFQPAVWNDLGFAWMVAGEPGRAVGALERAVELDPSVSRSRVNLGFALAAAGRDEEALASFRALLGPADAYADLGLARERRGDAPGAREMYRAALRLDPRHGPAREGIARTEPSPPTGASGDAVGPEPSHETP
ncbi:tetratricopeptide repeat protein [Myxococcota bacterium]|nr:tetratricopeptide repeat protein [Myxococcota bacterium]